MCTAKKRERQVREKRRSPCPTIVRENSRFVKKQAAFGGGSERLCTISDCFVPVLRRGLTNTIPYRRKKWLVKNTSHFLRLISDQSLFMRESSI